MNRFFLILVAALLLPGCALEEMRHKGRSDAGRKVIAIRSKFGAGGAKAERLNVYQKLIVRQRLIH